MLANAGDSVVARYGGGRTSCEDAKAGAKSEALAEAEISGADGACEASGSPYVGVSGGEPMIDLRRI